MANPLKKFAPQLQGTTDKAPEEAGTAFAPVVAAYGQHAGVASPARDLMSQLEIELSEESIEYEKYPLKWTLMGVTLFCGLSWYGLFSLIF